MKLRPTAASSCEVTLSLSSRNRWPRRHSAESTALKKSSISSRSTGRSTKLSSLVPTVPLRSPAGSTTQRRQETQLLIRDAATPCLGSIFQLTRIRAQCSLRCVRALRATAVQVTVVHGQTKDAQSRQGTCHRFGKNHRQTGLHLRGCAPRVLQRLRRWSPPALQAGRFHKDRRWHSLLR